MFINNNPFLYISLFQIILHKLLCFMKHFLYCIYHINFLLSLFVLSTNSVFTFQRIQKNKTKHLLTMTDCYREVFTGNVIVNYDMVHTMKHTITNTVIYL